MAVHYPSLGLAARASEGQLHVWCVGAELGGGRLLRSCFQGKHGLKSSHWEIKDPSHLPTEPSAKVEISGWHMVEMEHKCGSRDT